VLLGLSVLSLALSAAASGNLSIATEPDNAAVFVDGKALGVSPLHVTGVPAGQHRLRIVKRGYRETAQTVKVVAGEPQWLRIVLTPVD
jgi:hypothetical protein